MNNKHPACSSAAVAGSGRRHRLVGRAAAAACSLLLSAACDGSLSHRSVAEMADKVPIGQDIRCVRIELENGTIGIANGSEPVADYAGGARRAADTAEDLVKIQQVPFRLVVRADASRPDTLILTGPRLPAGVSGVLSVELGLRLPAELELEVAITGSGHITLGQRAGRVLATTGRGDLRFEGCRGPTKAETGRGTVIAFDHCGDLDVLTRIGDMQAFVREPKGLIRLVSGQGTVQCAVPEATEFDLDARAEVGFVGAGFGLQAEKVGELGSALVARQGQGTTKVVLRTGSGHLAFKPKKFD